MEQEVERIREAHRLLEATTMRKEKVEAAMRQRLENEVCRLRETCLKQNGNGLASLGLGLQVCAVSGVHDKTIAGLSQAWD